jgi:hypothetical protein
MTTLFNVDKAIATASQPELKSTGGSLTSSEVRTNAQANKIPLSTEEPTLPPVTVLDDENSVSGDPTPLVPKSLKKIEYKIFKRPAQDDSSSLLAKTSKFDSRPVVGCKELGDCPEKHDTMFNFIPGSCFEIGAALSLLENPGQSGKVMDGYAEQLADLIEEAYKNPDAVTHTGMTFKELIDKKILAELSPASDQIGRCVDPLLKDIWLTGAGIKWLLERLRTPSNSKEYEHTNMLTKIRSISAFGTIIRELMSNPSNVSILASLVGKTEDEFKERRNQINSQIRHAEFDNPMTRARSERKPFVDGKPIKDVKVEFKSAADYGLGFGNVIVEDSFPLEHPIREQYRADLDKFGRNGIRRQGQVIEDLSRPGLLTEYGAQNMPQAFKDAGLPTLLDEKKYQHGTGINRWSLKGTYPKQSQDHDMPAAGAHSGGTVDIFLAMNCMSKNSIFGQTDIVKPAGLLISSFMNFGGYHSFVETFPIAQAIANDQTFEVEVTAKQNITLYREIEKDTKIYGSASSGTTVAKYREAYTASLAPKAAYRESLETRKETAG